MKLQHLVAHRVSLIFLGLHLNDILIQEGKDAALEIFIIIRSVLFILGSEVLFHYFHYVCPSEVAVLGDSYGLPADLPVHGSRTIPGRGIIFCGWVD
jgi:hypothetical protein